MTSHLPHRPARKSQRTRVLAFIHAYHAAQAQTPTLREIQIACGFKQRSLAQYYVDELCAAGDIVVLPFISRGIRLAAADPAPPPVTQS